MNTYECAICLNVNHNVKLHCSTCGAVPAKYSPIKTTAIERSGSINYFVPFVIARGADRAEWHRTSRSYLRTVPLDYYAS